MNVKQFFLSLFQPKQKIASEPQCNEPVRERNENSILCMEGFSCKQCSAQVFADYFECPACGQMYTPRVLHVADWYKHAAARLVRKLDYTHAADVLGEATERLAKDQTLSPKDVFLEVCGDYGV